MTRKRLASSILVLSLFLGLSLFSFRPLVQAADPVTRAVLFYSPSCGHCEYVITEVLPPLVEQYGDRLSILLINVTEPGGQQLYQNAIQQYQIPEERLGVPTLVCGDTVLVGSREIPELFPGMIDSALAAGGVDWPDIPGLAENIPQEAVEPTGGQAAASGTPPDQNPSAGTPAPALLDSSAASQASTDPETGLLQTEDTGMLAKFKQDLAANSLAVIVLIAMLLSGLYVTYAFLASHTPRLPQFPSWIIPVISVLGLGVALYLSYVELFQADAVCGPVGNCNAVQNSPYAYLFGVIPVGVMGALGYIAILLGWWLANHGPETLQRQASLAIWGMAWVGMIFSIYLTFLEPFVIGATCMWCLTSAILMTLLLWATTPAALKALQHDASFDEELETDLADE